MTDPIKIVLKLGQTAGALNTLFSDLNTVVGGTIQISNNPGTSASNASIATAKSWTVDKSVL